MTLCHSEAARYLQFLSVPFLSPKAKTDVQASQRRKFYSAYYVIPSTARDLQLPTKSYYVYIMASRSLNLYTGVTYSIYCRVLQYKKGDIECFTKRYNINRLVYYEVFHHIGNAIAREKRIKSWTRAKRLALIASKKFNLAGFGGRLGRKVRTTDPSLRSG
jgi:putative endonuclease